ncbi:hypothetical protein EPI10_011390 [Gossypium australe]|uniref:Uncharacterized protein n=1 Tax=Gossypium australe TaxID=47621 RepID=A0A5B6W7Y5_9ROSI|nr:hypothetical protein EPI10_011390 [Gossypium australe]
MVRDNSTIGCFSEVFRAENTINFHSPNTMTDDFAREMNRSLEEVGKGRIKSNMVLCLRQAW